MTPAEDLAASLEVLAQRLAALARSSGAPEAAYAAADHLPELSTGDVLYDFGASLSIALGDLASAVEVAARHAHTVGGSA